MGHDLSGDHLDCSEVVSRVYFFLDHELEDGDLAMIETHMLECVPCTEKVDAERRLKALIARSCAEKAPEELRQRVLLSIREVRVRIDDA